MNQPLFDKRQVADSFGRAAATYDQAAAFQRRVGHNLMARLPADLQPQALVDLGCGTGYFTRVLASHYGRPVLGLDLAEGMLRHARQQPSAPPAAGWIAADAEALPLRGGSQDLLFSSLALQWCNDLPQALAEARRVLRAGGIMAFSTLVEGSLAELRDSWQQVDGYVHVNRFSPRRFLQQVLEASGFAEVHCEIETHVMHYPQLSVLTRELKALGAHNINPGRPGGLTGRARLQALTAAYERFRTDQGLPASWQVAQILLKQEA